MNSFLKPLKALPIVFILGAFLFSSPSFAYPPPITWQDGEPLQSGTPVRAAQISQLKTETQAAITGCGLVYSFSQWIEPEVNGTIQVSTQINVIRAALRYLYSQKLPGVSIPGEDVSSDAPVRVVDISNIRSALDSLPLAAACAGPVCGNSSTEPPETCDPPGGACNASCRLCGNGLVEAGETCEPPGTPTCDAACQTIVGACGNDGSCDAGETCAACPLDCPCPCTVKVVTGSGRNANDCHSYGAWTLSAGCPDFHPACPQAYTYCCVVFGQITNSAPSSVPVRGSAPADGALLYTVAENFYNRDQKNGWDLCSYSVYSYYSTLCYPPVCNDAICSGGETCDSCPADCGACPVCPDGSCTGSESCDNCPDDCGTCQGSCDFGICPET